MSDLGNLWFSVGLDDSRVEKDIEKIKEKLEQMGGTFSVDMSPVKQAIKEVEDESNQMREILKKNLSLTIGADDLQRTINIGKIGGLDGEQIQQAERMIQEFRQALQDAGSDGAKLDELASQFKRLKTEVGFLTKEQRAYNAEMKKADSKLAAQELNRQKEAALGAEGSIYRLEAALRELKDAYRQLSSSDRDSLFGQDLLNRINQADAELTSINTKMANNATLSRTFGKQYDGLFTQTQQLIRELPSATISLQQFIMAISNNLPLFADELAKASAKVKQMKEAGEEVTPVWKQLVKALFSWQSALMLAVVAVTAYGDEIAAFVKDLFKGKDAFDSTAEAMKNFSEAMKNGRQDAEKELSVLRELYSTATDTAESMDERTAAIRQLKEQYPDYLQNLSDEAILAGQASTKYKELTEQIISSAKARAAMDKITENSKELLNLEEQKANAEKNLEAAKQMQELQKAGNIRNTAGAAFVPTIVGSKELGDAASEVRKYEDEISSLTGKMSALNQANDKLSKSIKVTDLFGDNEETDASDTNADGYVSLYEQQREIQQAEQRINEAVEQARLNIQKNAIALMKEGNEKELAQINLDYDAKVSSIKKREKELLQTLQDEEYKVWQRHNPEYRENDIQFSTSITSLPETSASDFAKEYQQATEYRQQQTEALLNKTLAKYQDFADQRKAIEQKFNDDINFLESSRTKENAMVIHKAILLAEKEKNEALKEIADDEAESVFKDNDFLKLLFGDVSSMSFKALSDFISQARQLEEYLSGNGDSKGITFISEDQLKAITSSPEELDKLKQALDKVLYPNKKETVWQTVFNDFKSGFASLNSAKGFKEISGAIGTIGGAASMASENLSEMFSQMGMDEIAEVISGLGNLMGAISNIGQGFAKGGLIGGIGAAVGEAANLIGQAFTANARHKEALREVMNQAIQQQREYNLLLLEQNLLYEQASTIFGTDLYGKASNAAKVLADANKEFTKELKGLSDVDIVTGHKKTGLFGWGSGKDVYSSILSVYPELIDESGKFNKELAETIIQTRKMTDEDKAALQHLIDLSDQVEEAFSEMKDYLTDIFGELGNTMIDAMVSAFENGTDAAQKYIESVSDMLSNLAKQMIYSVSLAPIIQSAQEQMMDIAKNTDLSDEAKFEAYANVLDNLVSDAVNEQDNARKLWESYKKTAESHGFDISPTESGSNNGLSKSVQGINESQADLLASYANSMRGDLAVIRSIMEKGGVSLGTTAFMIDYTGQMSDMNSQLYALVSQGNQMSYMAEAQLESLKQIIANTSRNAIAAEKIRSTSGEILDSLNSIIGIGKNGKAVKIV